MVHDQRIARKFGADYRWVRGTGYWSYYMGKRFCILVSSIRVMAIYDPQGHVVYNTRQTGLRSSTYYRHVNDFKFLMAKQEPPRTDKPGWSGGHTYPLKIKISNEQFRHMVEVELGDKFLHPDGLYARVY